jgi:CheY-like chemotaxis protein
MALVLCTGWDQALLDTRALILKSAGHQVHRARTQQEVVSACRQNQFDVAVIGQSLSPRMKQVVASLVKEHCPNVKLLELYPPHLGKSVSDADDWLAVPADVPSDLAQRVAALADGPKRVNPGEA